MVVNDKCELTKDSSKANFLTFTSDYHNISTLTNITSIGEIKTSFSNQAGIGVGGIGGLQYSSGIKISNTNATKLYKWIKK